MKAAARVLEVRDGRARIECDVAQSACVACAARGGCLLRRLAGPGGRSLELPWPASRGMPPPPGARVVVEVRDGELLAAALRAYAPPLAGLLAAPLVAAWTGASELGLLAAAGAGLLAGGAVARQWLARRPPGVELAAAEGVHLGS